MEATNVHLHRMYHTLVTHLDAYRRTAGRICAALLATYRRSNLNRRYRSRWSLKHTGAVIILGLIALLYIVYSMLTHITIVLPRGVDPNTLAPFEPEVVDDFPMGDDNNLKIPRILHWTFKGSSIPASFQSNVEGLYRNNPDWTFYMWTNTAARLFIADTHPELLLLYDSYADNIYRADLIRYVVLYELGGVYVDLDVIGYRPLDRLLYKYTCIFPPEPFEHSSLRMYLTNYLLSNAIMICKPKHPFIKLLLDNLPRFAHYPNAVEATGPSFVTTVYMLYNDLGWDNGSYRAEGAPSNSPYFYKGTLAEDHEDAVYVANTQYFCNNIDRHAHLSFYLKCKGFHNMNDLRKRACANLARKGLVREKNKYTFLEHQFYRTYGWWHFYNYLDVYASLFSKDIREMVPHVKIYKGGA